MSLEQALAENTEALKALTAILQHQLPTGNSTAVAATTVKSEVPAKTKAVEAKVEEKTELTYEQVKVPFLALVSAKGRDVALAAIAPHANLKAIEGNPALYADILASILKASV
jgi:hypothetical protein